MYIPTPSEEKPNTTLIASMYTIAAVIIIARIDIANLITAAAAAAAAASRGFCFFFFCFFFFTLISRFS